MGKIWGLFVWNYFLLYQCTHMMLSMQRQIELIQIKMQENGKYEK
jgi:hypothetical protein